MKGVTVLRKQQVAFIPHPDDTSGKSRFAPIHEKTGQDMWMELVTILTGAKTDPHSEEESLVYQPQGVVQLLWGEQPGNETFVYPGDFVHIPRNVKHQAINAGSEEVIAIVARARQK